MGRLLFSQQAGSLIVALERFGEQDNDVVRAFPEDAVNYAKQCRVAI
jgi:hypothetical protein